MAKAELVPPERCSRCRKSIGPKATACLWQEKIVCIRCLHLLERQQQQSDQAAKAVDQAAQVINEAQLAYLRELQEDNNSSTVICEARRLVEKARREKAWRNRPQSKSKKDRVAHYVNALWLKNFGHHIRQYGVDQEEVRMVVDDLLQQTPKLASQIYELLERYPHSEQFLAKSPAELIEEMKGFLRFEWPDPKLRYNDAEDAEQQRIESIY